jgi:hypothetical protein
MKFIAANGCHFIRFTMLSIVNFFTRYILADMDGGLGLSTINTAGNRYTAYMRGSNQPSAMQHEHCQGFLTCELHCQM